jgi:Phospholipase_D-nuclease N-terminal
MHKLFMWTFVSILVVACSQEDWIRKMAPPEQQEIARRYIEQLRSRDFSSLEKAMDPSLAADLSGGTLGKMADAIPGTTPTSVKLVGANQFSSKEAGTTLNLTYEYQFGDKFMLINVARKMKGGAETIVGFHIQSLPSSLETLNRFTLAKKSALQYGILAAAIAAAVFTLYALVVCIRTNMARRKWLWILFILFGFGKIIVNWTTGRWDFTVLAAQLFSASAGAVYFGPWIISVSLPIGAAVFLSRRKDLSAAPQPKPPNDNSSVNSDHT